LDVDCPTATSCTALGYRAGNKERVTVFSGPGRWTKPVTLRLPATASRFGAKFFAVAQAEPGWVGSYYHALSCPSAGNCTVVGGYLSNDDNAYAAVLINQTAGHWARGIDMPVPEDQIKPRRNGRQPHRDPTAVSCASAGNCTVIGYYTAQDLASHQGLLLTEANGTWAHPSEPRSPASSPTSPPSAEAS
jgi:hypothetical protein